LVMREDDAKTNREAASQRGICPAIPFRSNTKHRPKFFPTTLYKGRGRYRQNQQFKLRCEKTARNYGSILAPVYAFILIRSVYNA
jgi:hypothetical protein